MLARVQESLQHFGITQFDEELFDLLDKESIKALTYPNPDALAGPARLVLPVGYRSRLLDVIDYAHDFNTRHSRVIDEVDWWNFTPEDLQLYLRSHGNIQRRLGINSSSDAAIATCTPVPVVYAASDPVLLDYVLKLLLGYDKATCPHHPVFEALQAAGVKELPKFLALTCLDVASMTYYSKKSLVSVPTTLPAGYQRILLVPQGYRLFFKKSHHRFMGPADWLTITSDDILAYYMSDDYLRYFISLGLLSHEVVAPLTTSVTKLVPCPCHPASSLAAVSCAPVDHSTSPVHNLLLPEQTAVPTAGPAASTVVRRGPFTG